MDIVMEEHPTPASSETCCYASYISRMLMMSGAEMAEVAAKSRGVTLLEKLTKKQLASEGITLKKGRPSERRDFQRFPLKPNAIMWTLHLHALSNDNVYELKTYRTQPASALPEGCTLEYWPGHTEKTPNYLRMYLSNSRLALRHLCPSRG